MANRTAADPHRALVEEALLEHFRGAKIGQFRFLVIFFVVLATLVYFAQYGETMSTQRASGIGAGLVFFLIAWLGFRLVANPMKAPGVRVLLEQRDEVVWAFAELQNNVPVGVSLGLDSGRIAMIDGATQLLLDRIRPALAHATLGFSPEIAKRFRADPGSLRRNVS